MSIFRDTLQKDIKASLENRQKAMTRRSTSDIQYLNSRNVWIRMASSVDVSNDKGLLAKQYVLQGGTLEHHNGSFNLKSGIGSSGEEAYSTKTPLGNKYRLGIRPMPGITGVDIKSKSAYGSLREATVNFQCWDIKQLEDLELLYMRPGYTVLLEWGWAPYLDVNGGYQSTFTDFYTNTILNGTQTDRTQIFKDLYDKCTKYGGNYDAIFGYVKNYNWSARADGGYDCSTTIITTGEVIESIKVNYVRKDLASQYKMYDKNSKGDGFLNSLFTPQGNTPSIVFSQYYQKNTLAGVWAELAFKLQDPTTFLSPYGVSILKEKNTSVTISGLTNYGDLNSFIDYSNPRKSYITLEAAFDIINEFILTKAKNDAKPLVKLSTKASGSTDLLCIAHPVQISIDPTVCMIKSPLWYDSNYGIASKIKEAVGSTSTSATTSGIAIAEQLKKASENTYFGLDLDIPLFLDALKQINNAIIFDVVNKYFIDGTGGSKWVYPEGLAGLIQEQFIKNGDDIPNITDSNVIVSYGAVTNVPLKNVLVGDGDKIDYYSNVSSPTAAILTTGYDMLGNILYLSQIKEALKPSGVTFDADLVNRGGGTSTFNAEIGNRSFTNIDDVVNDPKFGGVALDGNSTPYGVSKWQITQVKITVPSTSATAAALVLKTDEAVGLIKAMESLSKDFFVGSFPTSKNANTEVCIDAELGYIGNIYVSLDYLYRQSLNTNLEASDTKEKNEINLYSYIKGVMSGIQTSIGNINNFEIHVDPIDNNVARVIDVNYTERSNPPDLFELQVHNLNSIVRSYNLQSQIFPNQSSIIAIGSQAQGGGQGAIQNKTMVSFNDKLTDRILGEKVDPYDATAELEDLAALLASIIVLYATFGYSGIQPGQVNNLNINEAVSKAKNALRDLIVYFQIKFNSPSANRNILPFKFSFEMDGTGGLVIGNLFKIKPDDVIPKGYRGETAGVKLAQTITGISHTLQNNDWVTKVDALNIVLQRLEGCFDIEELDTLVSNAVDTIIGSSGEGGSLSGVFSAIGGFFGRIFGGAIDAVCEALDETDRSGKWKNLVKESYVQTTVPIADVVAYIKTTSYSSSIKRATYAIFAIESGRGNSGINNNYIGLQTDGGGFISTDANYVEGTTTRRDGAGNCRAFATYATWQKCIDHLLEIMKSRTQGSRGRPMVPTDATNSTFFADGYAEHWVGNKDSSDAKNLGKSLWAEAISKGL